MFEFAFAAAAILISPTPDPGDVHKRVQPVTESAVQRSSGATLASVAVTLECTARASGQVEDCKVLGETHPGLGFGEAAIALMRDAEVDPGPRDIQFARTIQFMP